MPRVAYLYSRYPVVSQTFCDSEMLALESMGFELQVVSLNAPPDSFRHERLDRLRAEIHYPPPGQVLEAEARAPEFAEKLGPLIAEHDQKYGNSFKAAMRARNAWHFAPILRRLGVTHVHVHFANRATHSALFLKKLGFTFSFTAHAQDFMVDLGSDELLGEMVRESEFTVCVSDFSRQLLCRTCPGNDAKVVRIYNGIELDDFPMSQAGSRRQAAAVEHRAAHRVQGLPAPRQCGLAAQGAGARRGGAHRRRGAVAWRAGVAASKARGWRSSFHLLGVRSQQQIKRELAEAHAFVLPSIVDRKGASDILPTVITEAMACRLPVVSTKLAGIPEMVADGETGLLVDPGDDSRAGGCHREARRRPRAAQAHGRSGTGARGEAFRAAASPPGSWQRSSLPSWLSSQKSPSQSKADPDGAAARGGAGFARPRTAASADFSAAGCTGAGAHRGAGESGQPLSSRGGAVQWNGFPMRWCWSPSGCAAPRGGSRSRSCAASIGEAMDGEAFYVQARRAVWLAEALPKRGVRHLHAFTSEDVVTVWLWKKLTGLQVSAAIEEAPRLSRVMLRQAAGGLRCRECFR